MTERSKNTISGIPQALRGYIEQLGIDKLNVSLFGKKSVLIWDETENNYHPDFLTSFANTLRNPDASENKRKRLGDLTEISKNGDVSEYPQKHITRAIVVGWSNAYKDKDGNTVTQAEHTFRFDQCINSLTHHFPTWVSDICAVIPQFESRSDRDVEDGEATNIEVLADGIVGAKRGVKKIITLEQHSHRLHSNLVRKGVEHLNVTANTLFAKRLNEDNLIDGNTVVISTDKGGTELTDDFTIKAAQYTGLKEIPLGILNKVRNHAGTNDSECGSWLRSIRGGIKGKRVILRDDIGDSLGTTLNAAKFLRDEGASEVILVYTHPVHSPSKDKKTGVTTPAREKLEEAIKNHIVDRVYTTDSRPLTWEKEMGFIHVVPVAPLLAKIAESFLKYGIKETRRRYGEHLLNYTHPELAIEEVAHRYDGAPLSLRARIFKYTGVPDSKSIIGRVFRFYQNVRN